MRTLPKRLILKAPYLASPSWMQVASGLAILLVLSQLSRVAAAEDSREEPAAPVFRRADRRPHFDDAKLQQLGILRFESRRLKLYTDVSAEKVQSVPPAVDAAYDALVAYFGPLPPNQKKTEFQVTGYLMIDKPLFRKSGLLPEDLPPFLNGRHLEQEFWANEQATAYYRRHLAIHEFTHCFMFAVPGVHVPGWYMEGMAELFGTHRIDSNGRYEFRVMPDRPKSSTAWGGLPLSAARLLEVTGNRCRICSGSPLRNFWKTRDTRGRGRPANFSTDIRGTGRASGSWENTRSDRNFGRRSSTLYGPDLQEMETEWALFTHELQFGFDLARAAIDFKSGQPLAAGESRSGIEVAANRGWQSSGVAVKQGERYQMDAVGEVVLAKNPKPWISQPQGISIVYSEGRPIGTLLVAVHREPPGHDSQESMLKETVVGKKNMFTASTSGTLYFRINDTWNSLANNDGRYQVVVRNLSDRGP